MAWGIAAPPGVQVQSSGCCAAKLAWRMDGSSISFRDSNSPGSRLTAFKEGLDFVNFGRSARLGFEAGRGHRSLLTSSVILFATRRRSNLRAKTGLRFAIFGIGQYGWVEV
jgi:hypothetical protein